MDEKANNWNHLWKIQVKETSTFGNARLMARARSLGSRLRNAPARSGGSGDPDRRLVDCRLLISNKKLLGAPGLTTNGAFGR